jgi:hypothetical protein
MSIPAPLASAPSSTSPAATGSRPLIRRTVFVLTDRRGWPIYGLDDGEAYAAPDPTLAAQAGFAWLDQDVALERLRSLLSLYPRWVLGLATVELVLGAGGWVAASIGGLRP